MAIVIGAQAVPAAVFQPLVDRNASINDTVRFLARMRRINRGWAVDQSLAHQVGSSLKAAGVQGGAIRKANSAVELVDSELRRVIVDEIFWFSRVGLLQLRAAGCLAEEGHITLARGAAYYSSLYFINALCRLSGRIPLYLWDYQAAYPGPTVMLAWDGILPAHRYYVSTYQLAGVGSHRQTWEGFFNTWQACPDATPDLLEAVVPQGANGWESNDRNDYTYRPWMGFQEVQSRAGMLVAQQTRKVQDVQAAGAIAADRIKGLTALATDPFLGASARAALRGFLILRFFDALADRTTVFKDVTTELGKDLRQQIASFGFVDSFTRAVEASLAS